MGNPASIDAIFRVAFSIESVDIREEYLKQACGNDQALYDRVVALLRTQDERPEFMESPPSGVAATMDFAPIAERPGTYISSYKLVEEIGEGGMGTVFMALQKKPIRRTVALKVIKPGMDSKQVVSRFEAERQTLALMDHPNIAKVLDGGTTESGRPYFVMELVKGIPITEYCDGHRLTNRERLELFRDVCSAVHHAHQKGIIHRDLKPSNVLVTQLDNAKPLPKIIDFGIAKATSGHLMDESLVTGFSQLVGTPMYMSPEQAELTANDIDTRSDVYSLGVLLYELLTGVTPFDRDRMSSVSFDEFRRIVQKEDPPRPSTRLSTLDAALETVAEQRHTDARSLAHEVSGELDWIVMKALEKDRTRRYESANELAKDVQRYLNDEAVEACPPSTVYRLRKFTRRNRTVVLATAAIGLALLLGGGVATRQAVRATRAEGDADEQLEIAKEQRRLAKQQAKLAKESAKRESKLRVEAETQRDLAEQATRKEKDARQQAEVVTDFLVEIFRSPDPELDGRKITVAEMLDQASKRAQTEFKDDHLLQAKLLGAIGQTYSGLGLVQEAMDLSQKPYDMLHAGLGSDHPETLKAMSNLAEAYVDAGRGKEKLAFIEEAFQLHKRVLGLEHRETLEAMAKVIAAYVTAGREALSLCEDNLRLRKKVLGFDDPDTLEAMANLAMVCDKDGQYDRALSLGEETLKLREKKLGPDHPKTLSTRSILGQAFARLGRWPEAIALTEETLQRKREKLGADHPSTLASMNNLASWYDYTGRFEDALALRKDTLSLSTAKLGREHPLTITAMHNLAGHYYMRVYSDNYFSRPATIKNTGFGSWRGFRSDN